MPVTVTEMTWSSTFSKNQVALEPVVTHWTCLGPTLPDFDLMVLQSGLATGKFKNSPGDSNMQQSSELLH